MIEPLRIVPTQVKTLMAEKMRDEHREDAERAGVEDADPGDEEVMPPREESDAGDPDRGVGDRLVRLRVLAREGADELGDHPHGRQDHDVDGGVAVEPEEVLEEHRIAAARRIEDPPAETRDRGRRARARAPAPAFRAPG